MIISILDDSGSYTAFNDDGCDRRQFTVTWTVPDDGTYYVEFGSLDGTSFNALATWSIAEGDCWSACSP